MVFVLIFFLELILLFFLSRFLARSLSKIFFKITKSKNITINLISLLFLPGVIIHELSHLLTALLFFVPVGEMEFVPKVTEEGVKLGGVGIGHTDPLRRAIIGFAPILFGVSLIILLPFYLLSLQTSLISWQNFLVLYLVFEISNTMFSSSKDLEGTIEVLGVLLILFLASYFMGFRLPLDFISEFINKNLKVITKMDFVLLVPLLIDFMVLGMGRTTQSRR